MVEGPNRNFEIFDALDFLAPSPATSPTAACSGGAAGDRAARRCHSGRLRCRRTPPPRKLRAPTGPGPSRRSSQLIHFSVPIVGIMRIISFIEDQRVVRTTLAHLSLRDLPKPRPPPVSAGADADYECVPCKESPMNAATCPEWSDHHRAAVRRWYAGSPGASRLSRLPGVLQGDSRPTDP